MSFEEISQNLRNSNDQIDMFEKPIWSETQLVSEPYSHKSRIEESVSEGSFHDKRL